MLRCVGWCRYAHSRQAKTKALRKEMELTNYPKPVPPTKECLSIWKDGLSQDHYGKIHGKYRDTEFVSMMSRIFDLVYKNIGIKQPHYKAKTIQYKLYRIDEIDTKLNKEIIERMNKLKYAIDVYELRQKHINKTIHCEPSIVNHSSDSYVFVDISPSKNKKNRAIVVRKPNGELDIADWDIRERMEVVFYGRDEQQYPYPLFTNLQIIRGLTPFELINVLSYVTYYIPPDSPLYHNVVGECYETICHKRGFPVIASTQFLIPYIYHCLVFSNACLLYLANSVADRSQEALFILAKAFAFINNKSLTYRYTKDHPNDDSGLVTMFLKEAKLIFDNSNDKDTFDETNKNDSIYSTTKSNDAVVDNNNKI